MTDREPMRGLYSKRHKFKGGIYYETRYVSGCMNHHGRRLVFWHCSGFDLPKPYRMTKVTDFWAWAVDAEFQGVAK